MELTKRHFETGRWTRLTIRGGTIESVDPAEGPDEVGGADEWVAPAFWDIQTNGRWGISFSNPALTVDQVVEVVLAQAEWGAARICPTLITASAENFRHGVKTIAEACESDPRVASCVVGIHLEGPFISEVDGYRGAHPLSEVRDPDWDLFQEFQDASGGRVVLMTLAPERPGAMEFIRKAVAAGVVIALGHTAADGPTLRAAVAAGASLSTHLGNGIASPLARHPNPIWEQAAIDSLDASLIADGHHIDPATLRVLVRAKTAERVILVSDASPLAALPPGRYGEWAVDPSGKIVVAGTPYLAGSNQGIEVGLNQLMEVAGLSLAEAIATATTQPARLLRRTLPTLSVGQPANLVVFEHDASGVKPAFRLIRTCVEGRWVDANQADGAANRSVQISSYT
ncbi:N-acetylglucosamine-6-phosphate deacetylase [Singulisphaera acidiphila]|uniref:N-acetylglucosamine-6-phosphate deacetylase n=1 Tax=Singulisphaera acidiphila (strain ATCC BAA-1392 / DSM 18658 / VKM B-2454 / MOB10) TaxID=886293 RepID=L0DIM6_SINAD|nr:amidohydrolase family protein [Singulisphaera acidiphila]AGA29244.1 N-acetylglucosamine-6-phosphate deacetylase [Singulisphaera acidiphila DSM 18658]